MSPWLHSVIIATVVAGTVAVGVASSALTLGDNNAAEKADRLPVVADAANYVTVEQRSTGVSTLERIRVN